MLFKITLLCPEFDVFLSNRNQVIWVKRIPFYDKDHVLVATSGCQLLFFLPVPHTDTMVIVKTNICQLLSITCNKIIITWSEKAILDGDEIIMTILESG